MLAISQEFSQRMSLPRPMPKPQPTQPKELFQEASISLPAKSFKLPLVGNTFITILMPIPTSQKSSEFNASRTDMPE